MAQANTDNSTTASAVSTRRRFLSQAAGVAAGGTALALATVSATAVAAAPMAALASSDADPIFDLIAQHRTARDSLTQAEEAHTLVERDLQASGDLYPRVTSRGNPYSGLPSPVSKTHSDIDMYSPADHYPDDNKREHDELAASIARRDARRVPIEEAMNAAWDAAREVLETLVQTVPTTMPGVMAMLKFQRDCDERVGLEMFELWHLSFICESVETALLNLQSRGWQGVGMV